jgi:hypothetical protein
MSYSKTKTVYDWQRPWEPDATPKDALDYMLRVAGHVLGKFDVAATLNDFESMARYSKEFRALATHLDAYRRMWARQWREKGKVHIESNVPS